MASTHAKAVRRAEAQQRLSSALGITQADLHAQARGDPELAHIMTLERLADAVDEQIGTMSSERDTLRQAILDASDDDLVAIPGVGEKSLEALRAWAAQEPEPETTSDAPPAGEQQEQVGEQPSETTETAQGAPTDDAPDGADATADTPTTDKPKAKSK